eukprot:TRINITY_DN96141_c0_g1_i1.p1 TRINITY_DN96141_c0_g1~~TRINITY_DN96141_c0_g1_i1.p1  ORF type:complete len:189 (-),score=30.30 TRINITY_DN96141_c0_g1_i1:219-785(-)
MSAARHRRSSAAILCGLILFYVVGIQHPRAWQNPVPSHGASRREVLAAGAAGAVGILSQRAQPARAADSDDLAKVRKARELLNPLIDLEKAEKWDNVRAVTKFPPVSLLWNSGESMNPLAKLGIDAGDEKVIELKEEIAGHLAQADQFTYDNVFIPFQPGNGKYRIKEPIYELEQAMKKLDEVIKLLS